MHRFAAALLLTLSSFALADGAPTPANEAQRPVLDVVFVLDTTGSMGGLLEGAKQKIWSIASRLAEGKPTPKVRVGLVAYRDQGDAYVTQVFGLTEDLDAMYATLRGFRADGGGDGPEAVQEALAKAVDGMQWSQTKRAAKMIFLVGDAPAHDQDAATLFAAAKRAIGKGIVVNGVRCGGDPTTATQFREVARLADGRFDSIAQGGGVVAAATPFDGELAKLNAALMDTALYAGTREAQAKGEARRLEAKALAPSAAADRIGYMAKSGRGGVGASGAGSVGAVDLAAAPEKAAELSEAELPPAMQKLSKEERVQLAKQQQQKRASLEKQIAELTKKRDAHLASVAGREKDSFDARVFESVKAAAAPAGIGY